MKGALIIALLAIAACSRGEAPAPTGPLAAGLLRVAQSWGDGATADSAFARAELERVAARVRALEKATPRAGRHELLNRVVFEQLGFVREVEDESLRFVLLPSVLRSRRGSCVGLGSLYLALGERLGWDVHGVMVPGHFFVRVTERAQQRNVELLRRGEVMPDTWYAARFPIPGEHAREYARALENDEVLGVVEYDVGNERKRRGNLRAAERAYAAARRHFPDFAEGHASAGAVAQLLGALDRAREAYRAARQANPHLPGVEHNLALLEQEQRDVAQRQSAGAPPLKAAD